MNTLRAILPILITLLGSAGICPAGWIATGSHLDRGEIRIDRTEFRSRIHAMWLGQTIANWTGLLTEGKRNNPPFLTDADWGRTNLGPGTIDFVLDQRPWGADDDTDIEYVYLYMAEQLGTARFTPAQINQYWQRHINDFIWVSNKQARQLMNRGIRPPSTGLRVVNEHSLMIDAQLTTELFGVLAPGNPGLALDLAELPIRATATGYAAHAAEFHVALFAFAPRVQSVRSERRQVLELVEAAREVLPDSSKSADIVDFVLADYLANPDKNNWERTRDRIYVRYQRDAAQYGFRWSGEWWESSVNLATGVMALLYGEGDFRRTVQIGTLSGWDSDNGTATMGALVGYLVGYPELRAQFPGRDIADTYFAGRTRDGMPDRTPGINGDDTFAMMADRTALAAERETVAAGGRIEGNTLVVPAIPAIDPLLLSPTQRLWRASANNAVRRAGGTVTPICSERPAPPNGFGSGDLAVIADGVEHDFSGREEPAARPRFLSTQRADGLQGPTHWIGVTYSRPVQVARIRFIEGDHFSASAANGGWFERIDAVRVALPGIGWTAIEGWSLSEPLDPARPFQQIDILLPQPITAEGIWIEGLTGGTRRFVTCTELDALAE